MIDLSALRKVVFGWRRHPRSTTGPLLIALLLILTLRPTWSFGVSPRLLYHYTPSAPYAHFSHLKVVTEKGSSDSVQGYDNEKDDNEPSFFFIRKCLPAEIGQASDILTEAFFKENTNFISYQWERLTTYLSLEGTYPKPGERHALFVACESKTGKVLGLAEIDDMPSRDRNATPRPYMFNVAVKPQCRRKGIASALVLACENIARAWGKTHVYLKVRDNSGTAISMYEKLGYKTKSSKVEKLNNKMQHLIIMSKNIGSGRNSPSSKNMTVGGVEQ